MKMRSAGRVQRIVFVLLAFALAFLACGAAYSSDVERQIPVVRDTAGSGLTMEISREGTRQTATPFLTLYNPTLQEIEDRIVRIVKMTYRLATKELPSEAIAAGSVCRIGPTGTPREDSGRPEEITVRSVKGFLKELRASRKGKPVPAVVVTAPEERLGRTDTSPH